MTAAALTLPQPRGACPGLSAPMATGDGLLVRLLPIGTIALDTFADLSAAARQHGNGIVEALLAADEGVVDDLDHDARQRRVRLIGIPPDDDIHDLADHFTAGVSYRASQQPSQRHQGFTDFPGHFQAPRAPLVPMPQRGGRRLKYHDQPCAEGNNGSD